MALKLVSSLSERLSQAISETVGSSTRLADIIGMSKQTISAYVTGVRSPKRPTINIMAQVLGVDPMWLMGYDVPKYPAKEEKSSASIPPGFEPLPKMVKRPLVGSIACGEPITAEENIEDYVDVPEDVRCDFCLRCKGDSMIDAGIHDGDVVYIHIQPQVENGQIAAVRIDGEATLKRAFWNEETQTLQLLAENRNFAPLVYTGPILNTVHIEGKAVGYTHWF